MGASRLEVSLRIVFPAALSGIAAADELEKAILAEVKRLAEELYADMNWKWFTNPVTKHPYLACYPQQRPSKVPADVTKDGMFGAWAAYSEHIFLYILAAGAPNPDFATGADSH